MSHDEDIEHLREVMKTLGESLPTMLKSLNELANDPKRVAAFATATAEFYKQLREAGVPEEKAAELTKVFMERTSFGGPLGPLFGGMGGGRGSPWEDLADLKAFRDRRRGRVVFRVGDDDAEEDPSPKGGSAGTSKGGRE